MTSPAITHPDIQISGDVRIHPRAVIASGVILQAACGCHVAIAPGACVGAGSIIQAHGGNIEIHGGAIIGAGCLIIGQGAIGENACIGYGSTIFQTSVQAAALLPPNSLVGDTSRSGTTTVKTAATQAQTVPHGAQPDPWQEEAPPEKPPNPRGEERQSPVSPPEAVADPIETSPPSVAPEVIPTVAEPPPPETSEKAPVVGQVYINQLLMTLFPHQNPLNTPKESNNP
ncbi:MAG: hypothetical protein VKJ86_11925 [Synechococcus sp.]|nr:hypothetical protein [Synechococcus sp.]